MKDLAPNIFRQRLLIEGLYSIMVDEKKIKEYYDVILNELNLTTYKAPIIHDSSGVGDEKNQGFEAFIPLIESGIAVYTWAEDRFFSIVMFTCKKFNEQRAIDITRDFFKAEKIEVKSF